MRVCVKSYMKQCDLRQHAVPEKTPDVQLSRSYAGTQNGVFESSEWLLGRSFQDLAISEMSADFKTAAGLGGDTWRGVVATPI